MQGLDASATKGLASTAQKPQIENALSIFVIFTGLLLSRISKEAMIKQDRTLYQPKMALTL
jgi:hypothetical protein